jgi:hypothetical protein
MELTNEIISSRWFLLMVLAGVALLLFSSGWVVGGIMSLIYKKKMGDVASSDKLPRGSELDEAAKESLRKDRISTGLIIGKCENLIIYLLTFTGEYTALAIIFTAKSIIRKEEIEKNSMFFLAGTMINVTYSLLISLAAKIAIIALLSAGPVKASSIPGNLPKEPCCEQPIHQSPLQATQKTDTLPPARPVNGIRPAQSKR